MKQFVLPGKRVGMPGHSIYVSIRFKLLITFTLLFSVVFAGAFYWFYRFSERLALDNVARELTAVAEAAAEGIDGDEHAALYASDLKGGSPLQVPDARYRRLVDWLGIVKRTYGTITDLNGKQQPRLGIYSYAPTNNPRVVRFVGSASAAEYLRTVTKQTKPFAAARFRELYLPPPAMIKGLTETTVDLEHVVPDQWGSWYSAFAPIHNNRGESVGAVGVDMRDTTVQAVRTHIANAAFPAFIITYTILFCTVWIISYGISRPLIQLTRFAERVAAGNYVRYDSAYKQGRVWDETTILADVFDTMVDKIREREETLKQQVVELKIEIDQARRQKQVSEIVDTELFQDLQARARNLRNRRRAAGKEGEENAPLEREEGNVSISSGDETNRKENRQE